jgi:hypothetical protein
MERMAWLSSTKSERVMREGCCRKKQQFFKTGYGLFDILHTRLKVCTPRNGGQAFSYRILWQNV